MRFEEVLSLKSDSLIDVEILIEINELLKKRGIETYIVDIEAYALQKCKKLLIEKGPSYILSLIELREDVLPKVSLSDRHLLIQILIDKLIKLSPSQNLTIIDPYLFATTKYKLDYIKILEDIFNQITHLVSSVNFITGKRYDNVLYDEVRASILEINPRISIKHKTTEDFHDRIWIVDFVKGLYVGTSLNGIGNKYAVIDNMSEEDIKVIVSEVGNLNLI